MTINPSAAGVRARLDGDKSEEAKELVAPPAQKDTAEALLQELGLPCFALDRRHAGKEDLAGQWLYTPQHVRFIGNAYNPSKDEEYHEYVRLPLVYDALIFVSRSTAARFLSKAGP